MARWLLPVCSPGFRKYFKSADSIRCLRCFQPCGRLWKTSLQLPRLRMGINSDFTDSKWSEFFGGAMKVRFWGTRRSLPVAPKGEDTRQRIKQALLRADGRQFDSQGAIEQFIDGELDFCTRHSYGGNTACVEIMGGENYAVCDMGSGLRCLGQQVMEDHGPGKPQ